MPTPERPYLDFGKPDLLALKAEALRDQKVREKLIHELSFRSRPWAKVLLNELLAPGQSPPRVERNKITRSKPQPAAGVEFDLEALRQTFTAEAEHLSRWGITPVLPIGMRNAVKEMWKKQLKVSEDAHGRSLEQLERDFRAAESEAALIVALDPRSRRMRVGEVEE